MSPRAAVRLRQLGFARVYDYAGGKKDWLAAALPIEGPGYGRLVSDALVRDVPTCELETPLAAALEPLDGRWPFCIVVAEDRTVLGLVRPDAEGATAGEVMEPGPTTIGPLQQLDPLLEELVASGEPAVPVTDADGRLLGIIDARHR